MKFIKNTSKVVCKFGGSSLASAENMKKVAEILRKNYRQFVVVSAPGKRNKNDTKITDLLINCFKLSTQNKDYSAEFAEITSRFLEIASELNVKIDLKNDFSKLKSEIKLAKNYDFLISFGEYFCAKIFAKFLNYEFLDAKDFLIMWGDNEVDFVESKKRFISKISVGKRYVIPGFYGVDKSGKVKTFSRGGSDLTGAIVAVISGAKIYENYTDVDGFLSANPQVVPEPKLKKFLSYGEVRALSYFGANVLHPNCVQFLKQNDIVLNLKNTFNPNCPGTFVLPKTKVKKELAGISGAENYAVIKIKKYEIHSNILAINIIDNIIKQYSVKPIFTNFSLDQISIIIKDDSRNIQNCFDELQNELQCENIFITKNVAIICVCGEALKKYKSTNIKILSAINSSKIDTIMYHTDLEELFMLIFVRNEDYNKMTIFLHDKLFL